MDVRIEDLPPSLQEIVEVIGLAATVKLVEHWGGVRLWVPSDVSADHQLRRRLGPAADKLARHFGLELLTVPRAVVALRRIRNDQIRARKAAGETAARLAREFCLTERQVWYIVEDVEEDEQRRQGALF